MKHPIRCLLVDDERLARDNLRALLNTEPGCTVVGEVGDLDEAASAIARLVPDLVFLDIQLPGGSGFDLLKSLEHPPAIVFVTAYDCYALRAFEVNALDYLLKPVDPIRLRETLRRMRPLSDVHRPKVGGSPSPMLKLEDDVLIQSDHAYHLVHLVDILTIMAAGNYTEVQTADGINHLTRQSMAEWERRLPPDVFIKVDRSLVLNVRQIRKTHFLGRSAKLELGPGATVLELGRAAATRLKRHYGNSLS